MVPTLAANQFHVGSDLESFDEAEDEWDDETWDEDEWDEEFNDDF